MPGGYELGADPDPMAGAFELARRHHARGDLGEAQRLYRSILNRVPNEPTTLTMLASVAYQLGEEKRADDYLDRAIEAYSALLAQQPGNVSVRAPLVNVLLARNRRSDAERLAADLNLPVQPVRATAEEFVRRRRSGMERRLPPMLINAVPKSASESIWNKLAQGLGLAQCHLSLGLFPECCLIPARVRLASQGGLIVKEHIPATAFNIDALISNGIDRVVFHVRDPRQATLSWAHFVHDDVAIRLMGPIWRKIVPPAGVVQTDLGRLIDWCIENYLPLLIQFMLSWQGVRDNPEQPISVLFQTFEHFRLDPGRYFDEVLDFYRIDRAEFISDVDAETVHLRKGLVDEWRSVYSEKQKSRAWRLIPPELAELFGWRP